jgi:hypothetical protein
LSRELQKIGVVLRTGDSSDRRPSTQTNQLEEIVRFMSIPPFPRTIEIPDFEHLVRTRIIQEVVHGIDQALSLLGYMAWPNDPETRAKSIELIRRWQDGSKTIPKRLLTIQRNWNRVGDIFNIHMALTAGDHEKRRGGPSVGKAIEVVHAFVKSRGARKSNLWRCWEDYKDVAHLVTAANVLALNARDWAKIRAIGKHGPLSNRLQPFQVTLLMPDFVIALALSLQEYGLNHIAEGSEEPMLNPHTLWRIAPDINVVPVQPPPRTITKEEFAVLKARRAGNRGKRARQREARKVSEGTAVQSI